MGRITKKINRIILFALLSIIVSCKSKVNDLVATMGCDLNQTVFDQAKVFEPLASATDVPDNALPTKASLIQYCPTPLSQGHQGSCTSWACAYAGATIVWAEYTGKSPDEIAFSPAFLYNQMQKNPGECTGTNIKKALEKLTNEGLVIMQDFPYDENDCSRLPSTELKEKALNFKLKGFNRLTLAGDNYKVDIQAIKQNLAQGSPVLIGMYVGGSFYKIRNEGFWEPTKEEYKSMNASGGGHVVDDNKNIKFGGHAMCVIGYDDNFRGGSFQIRNSWGNDWGDNGIFWMRYEAFEYAINQHYGEAYGVFPFEKKKEVESEPDFEISIGLLLNETKRYIPFIHQSGTTFTTTEKVPQGTKFKIAVKNSIECYIYVFGQETDGSSYILFPYTEKHSPYCGITGTRLFPKDYSLVPDNLGTKDVMAVIFSKKELDFNELNSKINQIKTGNYEDRILKVLKNELITNIKFYDGNNISFKAVSGEKDIVAVVFEINK